MSQGQQTKQIIDKATSAVSKAQKEYMATMGTMESKQRQVNISRLKRKLTEIVDGYSKAHSRILNEMDITEPASKQKKKQFVKQYLKENLNQNLITSCQRTKGENVDKEFSKEILQILKENFSKPLFVCADTGEVPKPPGQKQQVKPQGLGQSKRPQSYRQKGKKFVSSLAGAVGGFMKKKDKPAVINPQQSKEQSVKQKLKRNFKGLFGKSGTQGKGKVQGKGQGQGQGQGQGKGQPRTQKPKSLWQRGKQKVSSGITKAASMIPKREVCNEEEALMLIRLLQANKKQLVGLELTQKEKKIALQGLDKRIADSDAQIKEMYENIKKNMSNVVIVNQKQKDRNLIKSQV